MTTLDPDYETLSVDLADGVARVTLNRPEARNALNMQCKAELADALRRLGESAEVRCMLLTGSGEAFCAGGDVREMDPDRTPEAARLRMRKLLREVFVPLARFDKPVVAAVNGHAHGAGLSLALACDIVIASDRAVVSLAFARIGLVPDCGSSYFLTRLIGANKAKELLFTAARLSATEALEAGLVNRVVSHDELESVTSELARTLAQGPTVAFGLAKRLIDQAPSLSFDDMVELESYAQGIAMSTSDHREAVAAFREKRAPVFTGQ